MLISNLHAEQHALMCIIYSPVLCLSIFYYEMLSDESC